jgi:hypothetical protein
MSSNRQSGKTGRERFNREGQGRALSRVFSKLDVDFMNQFAETGIDNGPEAAAPEEARKFSNRLDIEEAAEAEEKFSGFAGMFKQAGPPESQTSPESPAANSNSASVPQKKSVLGSLFDPDEEPVVAEPADEANPYIHKRNDAKSRRGLYTGVLKRPVFGREQGMSAASRAETTDISKTGAVVDVVARAKHETTSAPVPPESVVPNAVPRMTWPNTQQVEPNTQQVEPNTQQVEPNTQPVEPVTQQVEPTGQVQPAKPVQSEFDPLAPEELMPLSEFGKSSQGTVSFIKPDIAALNALSESAKERRIEQRVSRWADEPVESRPIRRGDRKWARPESASGAAGDSGAICALITKFRDLCSKISSLCQRRVD